MGETNATDDAGDSLFPATWPKSYAISAAGTANGTRSAREPGPALPGSGPAL